MQQLHQQMQVMQRESVEKLGVLAQTTMDLRQRSEDIQGAAQQLTSALSSPNAKGSQRIETTKSHHDTITAEYAWPY